MSQDSNMKAARPGWHHVRLDSPFLEGQAAFVLLSVLFIAANAVFLPNPNLVSVAVLVQLLLFSGLSLLFALVAHTAVNFARTRSIAGAVDHSVKVLLSTDNLARAIPTILLVGVFMFTFPSFKSHIPDFNPFVWDAALAEFDRILHFGHSPWELLAAVTGYGAFTVKIDQIYYLWFPVVFTATAAIALIPGHNDWRHRYLLSFVLAWIVIGCILAVGYSSVGPIFYDRLYGGSSGFTALTAQLEAVNSASALHTLHVRDQLWQAYSSPTNQIISGISAMPSMHNAIAVLLFLAARHGDAILKWMAGAFAAVIFIGSIHLGWHYAADGYVSAIAIIAIWKFTGWYVKRTAHPL